MHSLGGPRLSNPRNQGMSFDIYGDIGIASNNVNSENEVVSRGVKGVDLIYQLTGRVPTLIKQSHLEDNEGQSQSSTYRAKQTH